MLQVSPDRIEEDLALSGLVAADIRAEPLQNVHRAATGIPSGINGYTIPYYDFQGQPIAFYRSRAFDFDPKYKQTRNLGNHIYFPKGLKECLKGKNYVIITEGEKKAACCVKNGIPAVAVSGVDSWRNKTILLPEGVKMKPVPGKEQVSVKIDDIDSIQDEQTLAMGLKELMDYCVANQTTIIICYDSDKDGTVKFEVQRSAANFAFELRFNGIAFARIKQLVLPGVLDGKVGLDDFIQFATKEKLEVLIRECLAKKKGFPQHPNPQEYISKKLQASRLGRKEAQQCALAIVADLDARGQRLRDKNSGSMYFFADRERILMDASMRRQQNDIIQDTEFSRYLFRVYGIGPSDIRVLTWVATFFTAEEPIGVANPHKVLAIIGDRIALQINDSEYVVISGVESQAVIVKNNGDDGILFQSGLVQAIDGKELLEECKAQLAKPLAPLWPMVLKDTRVKEKEKLNDLLALLFYLSPFINRWRGTQLPIEMAIGEPGSGKSSLYELRLSIIIGSPDLRNAPGDLKDWYASIASTGGLHVTDNVQMMEKSLRARLSDEMCRLVTEPFPHVEMRKYFTNSDLVKLPINTTFAITAVQQPFHNADLMQRSVIIEFDKGDKEVDYTSNWSSLQLDRFGGRKRWLAHMLTTLHKFLKLAGKSWNPQYRAKYRLMNIEQAFMVMAQVLGMEYAWIPQFLSGSAMDATREADWAFEGLCSFAEHIKSNGGKNNKFSARDVADWAMQDDEYKDCIQLTNVRSLGRYLSSHKQMLAISAGFREMGKYANRDTYRIVW